jgi:hypothetical protein
MGRKRKGFAIFTLRRTNDKNPIGRIYMCRLIYSQSCKYRWAHTTAKQELFLAITCSKYTAKGKMKNLNTQTSKFVHDRLRKKYGLTHTHTYTITLF